MKHWTWRSWNVELILQRRFPGPFHFGLLPWSQGSNYPSPCGLTVTFPKPDPTKSLVHHLWEIHIYRPENKAKRGKRQAWCRTVIGSSLISVLFQHDWVLFWAILGFFIKKCLAAAVPYVTWHSSIQTIGLSPAGASLHSSRMSLIWGRSLWSFQPVFANWRYLVNCCTSLLPRNSGEQIKSRGRFFSSSLNCSGSNWHFKSSDEPESILK